VSRALRHSLSVFQRLFAPFLQFVSEEVWSWWQEGSVHRASWPLATELAEEGSSDPGERARESLALDVTADALREVRKAKSEARQKMRAPVRRVVVHDTTERLQALELGSDDLLLAGSIERLDAVAADEFAVEVELAEESVQ
jgi:valyl-tRNA synthetase